MVILRYILKLEIKLKPQAYIIYIEYIHYMSKLTYMYIINYYRDIVDILREL